MKKCPYCGEEIQDEAIKCKHCGELIHDVETTPTQSDLIETDAPVVKLCPSCHAFQDSRENKCPNCSYDLTDVEPYTHAIKTPSLKAVVLMPLLCLFGPFIINFILGLILGFTGAVIGVPNVKLISLSIKASHVINFFFYLIITIFLVKRYNGYLFSGSWKTNLYSRLKTGLRWSIPIIFFVGLVALAPVGRAAMLKTYLLMTRLSLENITIIILIVVCAELLVVTFVEELTFRGMIQQHIKKYRGPRISVLITAGVFAIAHLGNVLFISISLADIVALFVLGILTGFAFNKFNSCISSFIPHLVFNLRFIIVVPLMLV